MGGEVFPALGHSPFFGYTSPLQPCAQKLWPLYLGIFVNGGATPSVHVYALSVKGSPVRDGLVFGSDPPGPAILPFVAPPPLQPCASPTSGPLRRGPPRATKVQQLLIFGVPPSPGEADRGGGGLLPMSVRQGRPARFSPDFRASARKRDRRGLARGISTF